MHKELIQQAEQQIAQAKKEIRRAGNTQDRQFWERELTRAQNDLAILQG